MTKIRVKYFERIDDHEFSVHTDLTTGKKTTVLGRDLEQVEVPAGYVFRPPYVWNGKRRIVKKLKGKYYLVTTL